jgi:acetylornithine deacetylase/succinyl-diaminopimelate desuccinylase-like protein
MASTPEATWDEAAIRRAIRLLGAYSSRIDEPQTTALALRLVWDIAQRRGAPTEIFQIPGTMPLVVVGNGPILLITHLDDPHPLAQVDDAGPPSIAGDLVSGPGITRKAGVLAALGAILTDDDAANQITLAVEADRHSGSPALSNWLDATERAFDAAVYEVADLPVPAPAIYLSATGVVSVAVSIEDDSQPVERIFGGVQADIGHQLAATLASMKSVEGEVLIPGFYDDAITPEVEGLAALQGIAAPVGAWLTRGTSPSEGRLSSSHLTLGSFLAPSLVVRDVTIQSSGPYLARRASAVVEARIMPGQDAGTISRAITAFITDRLPAAQTRPLLTRPSSRSSGFDEEQLGQIAPVLPVAAGNSPAGLLDAIAIPTVGYATFWRDPSAIDEQVSIAGIAAGSATIRELVRLVAMRTGVESPR